MGKLFSLDSPAMRFFGEVFDLILLNFLTLACCLPVVTAGASLTAMHYVLFHKVDGDDRGVIRPFFHSFRENFAQATAIWIPLLVAAALIAADIRIRNVESGNFLARGIDTLLLLPVVVLVMVFLYAFPILSRFSNTISRTLANALTAAIVFFPRTIAMAFVQAAWLWICWNFPLRLTPFLLLLGFIFPWYLCARIYRPVLLRMEGIKGEGGERETGAPEAEEIEEMVEKENDRSGDIR